MDFHFAENRKLKCLLLLAVCCCLLPLHGQFFGLGRDLGAGNVGDMGMPKIGNLAREDIDMSADSYEYVGSNLVARGHAVIKVKSLQITADAVTVNLLTKDLEAAGNVVFSVQTVTNKRLTPEEYEKQMENPAVKVVANDITTQPDGNQMISASLIRNAAYLTAERASGNLESGSLQFRNFVISAGFMYFRGEFAERYPDGTLKMFDSRMSTCEYELDSNAHYDILSNVMTLNPREANRGLHNYNPDYGEHSLLMLSNFINVWNVPILWLPILYKPKDANSFGIRFEFGNYSRWGYYLRTVKEFELLDDPAIVRAGLIVDYYQQRGFGFGATVDILTENSKTEFFGFYIRDRNPYMFWDKDRGKVEDGYTKDEWYSRYGRYLLPKNRYEFRLANLTHLTPRLDFRGVLDVFSDFNFLEDYFEPRYDQNVQPPTFAALEYQGEKFSATLQATIRVNSFYTALDRRPELRFDFFRQELFENIYYQGQTSAGYYWNRWREYDYSRMENPGLSIPGILTLEKSTKLWPEIVRRYGRNNKIGAAQYLMQLDPEKYGPYFEDPKDYKSFRFDTLHGLYYPFKLFGFLNLIPRALGRFTAYSNSPKEDMDIDDLYTIYMIDQPYRWPSYQTKIRNYDHKGGARYRFAFELGLEGNVKLSRTWQTPKNAFWEIDGLRHVAVPYFNLVYIPPPTVSYKNIYYFDDVDQIDRQAFIRLGIQNRLQTRKNNQIYQWISMENYWDFHFEKTDDFNHIGDLGTIFRFTPTPKLSLFSEFLLDVGGNNDHDQTVRRGRRDVGRPGISWKLINRFSVGFRYKIATDWVFSASYNYSDAYRQRTIYSMGSTLAQINATTQFRSYVTRNQVLRGSLSFPTFDKRLKGAIYLAYDVDADLIDNLGISLRRDFHCWYLILAAGLYTDREYSAKEHWKSVWGHYINITVGLSAMPGLAYSSNFSGEQSYD
ncbi:MAG: hypothetical protein IJS14_07005 [Lentisphaeria bacterium]|nr:hypothetical protein [Lentisphaeria bacterium]